MLWFVNFYSMYICTVKYLLFCTYVCIVVYFLLLACLFFDFCLLLLFDICLFVCMFVVLQEGALVLDRYPDLCVQSRSGLESLREGNVGYVSFMLLLCSPRA